MGGTDVDAAEAERILVAVWNGLESCYNACRQSVFEPRARELMGRAGIAAGAHVLDLGTGTGIAAFQALERAGPGGCVLGIDASDGLLRRARERARGQRARNVEFLRTSMISLALPGDAFDHVLGNYSVCCSPSYERTLREAHRVLRSGGCLTYNHEGPHPHPAAAAFKSLLEEHRVAAPPEHLRRIREASAFVEEGMAPYKDPFQSLGALEAAGFRETAATITFERLAYDGPEDYLNYKLAGSPEVVVLSPQRRAAFRDAAVEALRPYLTRDGLVLEQEVLTLHGVK